MTGRTWFAVDVTVLPTAVGPVEAAFDLVDAIGTEVNSLKKKLDEPIVVTGSFESPIRVCDLRGRISEMLAAYDVDAGSVLAITTRTVEDEDWLVEWKRYWKPTEAGKFIVSPPWIQVDNSEKTVIYVEPNMAFGTGTHETTRLCLRAIGAHYRAGETVLDVGTGTGILAIAAAKLGGDGIQAYDTDSDSVTIALENAVLNEVGERIRFFEGPITTDTPACDVVVANLTLDVILPILSLLLERSDRLLILSGILAEQSDQIRDALASNGVTPRIEQEGEWISLIVDRAFS